MAYSYSNSNGRKIGINGHPVFGVDDLLSDELPDYSSRRSSYSAQYNGDQKTSDGETERHRKISTASNMLEVPGSASLDRQNSLTSTASLVSNSSVRTFSYQNFRRPKIRNSCGGFVILIGLLLLVIGICLLIFGATTSLSNNQLVVTIDSNQTSANNSDQNVTQYEPHTSALKNVGYFLLFSGILIILVGISTIFCIHTEKPMDVQTSPNLERRVSTIEIEPPLNVAETAINKPEIMITTENLGGDQSYRKFPTPNFMTRPKISIDESNDPNFSREILKRFQF